MAARQAYWFRVKCDSTHLRAGLFAVNAIMIRADIQKISAVVFGRDGFDLIQFAPQFTKAPQDLFSMS